MRLGEPIGSALYDDWRFVEEDMHNISGRVTEYDSEAKLARQEETGHLGLARRIDSPFDGGGHIWVIARRLHDQETGDPLTGEPDARVLNEQRSSDAFRVDNLDRWRKAQERMWVLDQEVRRAREIEEQMENAEKFVWHARTKDLGHKNKIWVPASVANNG
jgi:hypothetical protein